MTIPYKSAKKFPKTNLVKPFDQWLKTDPNAIINGPHEVTLNPAANYNGFRDNSFQIRPGGTYTFSVDEITTGAVIFIATVESGTTKYTTLADTRKSATFTLSPTVTSMWMETHAQTSRGVFTIKNPMLIEGNAKVPFEPYQEINKSANKVSVSKNLIPNFNDPRWFQDDTAPGGTMEVDQNNPHKMKIVLTASAQSRIIHIPVQNGKAYTFSFANIVGLYRLYKGRVLHHDLLATLVQDASPVKFSFVVDSSYGGYVTLRLTNGSAGTYTFENLQLEEGYANTSFNPYEEVLKKSSGEFFNGINDCIVVTDKPTITTQVIIEAEIKLYSYPKDYRFAIASNRNGSLGWSFTVGGTQDGANGCLGFYEGGGANSYSNVKLELNKFYKVKVIANGTDIQFFVNDVKTGYTYGAPNLSWTTTSNPLYIGRSGHTTGYWFNGEIRNLKMYNSISSDEPVLAYNWAGKKSPSSPIQKAPYRNLPFRFQRESVEMFDGVQYGLNNPRIKGNGILIEEGTINLYTGDSVIGTNFSYINQDGWKKVTNVAAGVGATASMGLRNRVDLSKITNGQTYSCSATVYNPHDYAVDVLQDWCDVGQSNLYTTTIQPKETKMISVTASRSAYDATYRFYDIAPQGNGNTIWIKEIQVENKSYPTSYTSAERKADTGVSKILGVIDNVEGTIEFTYIPSANQAALKGNGRTYFSVGQGQNFRVWNWGNGDTHVVNFDMTSATGTRQYFDYIPSTDFLKKDVPVTFKITWDSAWINLFVNGEKVIYKNISSGGGYNSVVTTQPLYIGTNNTEVLPMPGIYKDITITDRNKKVIFQL
ncbi:LamG-like jellyroll fold domain-containing protein [Priestia sp. YIM B13551]|uniref:LamG-like jellyroll fold domain-containing protein n=1 Tax=Priestia sp. YIM B13551 TaxID=3366306 RepID=UPI00366D7659